MTETRSLSERRPRVYARGEPQAAVIRPAPKSSGIGRDGEAEGKSMKEVAEEGVEAAPAAT